MYQMQITNQQTVKAADPQPKQQTTIDTTLY